jgi:sugar-specific transcriptional regulator TrmB
MTITDEKFLSDAGLTKDQAKIYLCLLENGLMNARSISSKTSIGRAFTYKILDQLLALGLVEKKEYAGKVAFFFPTHPQKIKDICLIRKNEMETSFNNLNTVFASLVSSYNVLLGKPNVQFFEGVEGLRKVYDDILEIGQDILVISAPVGEGKESVLHLIKEQIERQVARNIKTKAITPHSSGITTTPVSEDERYLITRKIVPAEKLKIPAQIIIYGDKVAITNFKEVMVTILMESKHVKETFSTIFDYMWEKTE